MELGFDRVEVEPKREDDDIAKELLAAYQHYTRGNYKAAMHHGAYGLNLLGREKNINGGGWT